MTIGKAPLLAAVDDFADVRIALMRLVSSAGFDVQRAMAPAHAGVPVIVIGITAANPGPAY